MNSDRKLNTLRPILRKMTFLFLMARCSLPLTIERAQAASDGVVLWDTGSRITDEAGLSDRAGWKTVPSELFGFEADPAKASSDPGYYGREYSFSGDAVVENRSLTAVFQSTHGRAVIYSRAPDGAQESSENSGPGKKIVEVGPLPSQLGQVKIDRLKILRNADDEVGVELSFSTGGDGAAASAVFVFDRTGIVEVRPGESLNKFRLESPIQYGIVPSFVGDDLIYDPSKYPPQSTLRPPSENLFLGLLEGGDHEMFMTWPEGKQQMALHLGDQGKQKTRLVKSIDFDTDGQSFYLAALNAPGIWHREVLAPSYLEKDVASAWRRPFPAKWQTQLNEAGVKTTFAFRGTSRQIWRGVPGSYTYPVWFNGDQALYHLSKKVPPKGESLIYFLEGQNTPHSISTPVDVMKATLGRQMCEPILDLAGRKLRTHHRRGGDGVHRSCTCGYTEAIQAVFKAGQEVEKKTYVQEALDDMIFFIESHLDRIDEYRTFADDMTKFLQEARRSSPVLKPYLENLEQIVQQIPQEYDVQRENMKSMKVAADLSRRTIALTRGKAPGNLEVYMGLFKEWRGMGGAQDYVLAQCHSIARKLFQEAGYGCVIEPGAPEVAVEIRARCRQILRNADGYEIWANY
jgi:hypothetical protein